jgi:hypothetical protein
MSYGDVERYCSKYQRHSAGSFSSKGSTRSTFLEIEVPSRERVTTHPEVDPEFAITSKLYFANEFSIPKENETRPSTLRL